MVAEYTTEADKNMIGCAAQSYQRLKSRIVESDDDFPLVNGWFSSDFYLFYRLLEDACKWDD